MDPFGSPIGDPLNIQEMIDCDMRSSDFDRVLHGSCPSNFAESHPNMELDSPSPNTSSTYELDHLPWLQQQHLYHSGDFEPGGVLVNPQTGLPIQTPPPQPTATNNNNVQLYTVASRFPGRQMSAAPSPSPDDHNPVDDNPPTPEPVEQHHVEQNGKFPKPAYSYSCLIAMALKNSRTGNLPVSEIYSFMTENFPYFKTAPNGWKNSVRHNLSLNKCFEKVEKPSSSASSNAATSRKGCLWAMNPSKICKMEEEVQKWSRKDPQAIKRSMARPENLGLLEKGRAWPPEYAAPPESPRCPRAVTPPATTASPVTVVKVKKEGKERNGLELTVVQVKKEPMQVNELDMFDAGLPLDTSLPDLNLQSGIWDELDEAQVQFGISMTTDVPSPTMTLVGTANGSAMETTTTSIQGNYVYSQLNNNNNNPTTHLNNHNVKMFTH